jgi:hypothetical protein
MAFEYGPKAYHEVRTSKEKEKAKVYNFTACIKSFFDALNNIQAAATPQSVYRPATAWRFWGSNPNAVEILRVRPDRPWGSPSLLHNGYWVFSGGKAVGVWF